LLVSSFGTSRGAQLSRIIRRAGPVHSVLEFYIKSRMTAAEFAKISPMLTMSNGTYATGLINVNTASETVLECVPGINATSAAQIVSTRQGQTPPLTNLAWVAQILGPAASIRAGPYLTAQTFQISADVAAVGHHGRGYRRTLFVIDASTGTPQIVFRRNLSALGWALGSDARQLLASQQQPGSAGPLGGNNLGGKAP
jgi:type II secretory pathway component PulK